LIALMLLIGLLEGQLECLMCWWRWFDCFARLIGCLHGQFV